MPVTVPPQEIGPPQMESPPAAGIDNGVIEEARRRQHRRRVTGVALGGGALAIAIFALLIGGAGEGGSGTAGEPPLAGSVKLALVHGRALIGGQPALMGVTPSLQAGNVGVCVQVAGTGGCNGPLPSAEEPVYGGVGTYSPVEKVGPEGQIDATFTGPGVAAIRVAHLGTFKTESAAGLPPGAKQVVFYRAPGARGTVLPPGLGPQVLQSFERARQGPALTETLLDAAGREMPASDPPVFTLPNRYWQAGQSPPTQGRCAMRSSLPGAHTAWGQVATKIAPDRAITVAGWLTCLHTWISLDGASYETAILLDAKSPGSRPAMLWGAIPLAGHPGIVQIPAVQRAIHFRLPRLDPKQQARILAEAAKRVGRAQALADQRRRAQREGQEQTSVEVLTPPTVARRVGAAWLLVRAGDSLAQRIALLEGLHVTKIELHP
jgi:hypothetical protein